MWPRKIEAHWYLLHPYTNHAVNELQFCASSWYSQCPSNKAIIHTGAYLVRLILSLTPSQIAHLLTHAAVSLSSINGSLSWIFSQACEDLRSSSQRLRAPSPGCHIVAASSLTTFRELATTPKWWTHNHSSLPSWQAVPPFGHVSASWQVPIRIWQHRESDYYHGARRHSVLLIPGRTALDLAASSRISWRCHCTIACQIWACQPRSR